MSASKFNPLEERKLDLVETLEGKRTRYTDIRDPVEFNRELNRFFLQYVLDTAQIDLAKLTNRSFENELSHWDNKHLYTLAEILPTFIANKVHGEKFRYLVTHSIQGDLLERLMANDATDKFSVYGHKVIQDLEEHGISSQEWMHTTPRPKYFTSKNPNHPFDLELKLWRRDFRKEYAIGNISQCCIALNSDPLKQQYKPVLLDYFLDPAVQVSRIRRIDGDGNLERIGQIYMIPLLSKGKINAKGKINGDLQSGLILGVTSVELNEKYRNDIDVVPPIINGILNEEGYREEFGFKKTLIGGRFNLGTEYFRAREQDIVKLQLRLKQLAHNKRKEKCIQYNNPEEQGRIQAILDTLNYDLGTIDDLLSDFQKTTKLAVEKFGLRKTNYADEYRGSNYFDMLGRGEDGFIKLDARYQRAEGLYIGDKSSHRYMETKLRSLTNKYKKRK